MKHLLFLLLAGAVLVTPRTARACDVCGCSGGGGYFGILPQFQRHFFGMRWQERVLDSYSPASSLDPASNAHSIFRTLDLWGRWYPLRRVQVLAFVPVHFFQQTENEVLTSTRGLGDATLLANYSVFNTGDSVSRTWKHSLQIGCGIQLPTGKFRLTDSDGVRYHANLQPGTGSTDALINIVYTLRRGSVGMQFDAQTRVNTENPDRYRFGHRQNAAVRLFWWKNLGRRVSILPRAGVTLDAAQRDVWYGSEQKETGGYAAFADLGMDVYLGNLAIGAGYQTPLQYHLGNGNVTPKGNLAVSATWAFGRKKAMMMPAVPVFRNVQAVKN
ncbi:MAG TPA: hypothetical protein PLO67_10475 [Saprospiraceae bacterium]|nr:hypothetical protein [Saprospiraceae bacterium]HPI06373.1 hypothetical protein [Saprospiraceae bacterium]